MHLKGTLRPCPLSPSSLSLSRVSLFCPRWPQTFEFKLSSHSDSLNGCNYRNMMSPSLASLFCSHRMKKTRLLSYKSRLNALRCQQPQQLWASSLLSWLLGLGCFPIWFPLPKITQQSYLTPDTNQKAILTVQSSAYQRMYLHL